MTIGIILLAAGASTRFGGKPKQLITFNGVTLVRRAAEMALAAELGGPVVVVVGANKDVVVPQLDGLPVTIIDNGRWEQGMSSSLKTGLAAIYLTRKDVDAVVVLLSDQPLVDAGLVRYLALTHEETGKPIVACRYAGQLGVPALFHRDYFSELLALEGDKGAKWIIVKHKANCAEVLFEAGAVDFDSPADIERFRGRSAAAGED